MKVAGNRLPALAAHGFGGSEIDRTRPVRFRLNGRAIEGFAGDTVLSAVLAAGQIETRNALGDVVALDEGSAPPLLARHADDPRQALPMHRIPALDGLDLVTPRCQEMPGSVRRAGLGFLRRSARSAATPEPWRALPVTREVSCDLLVVGGGVAGLAAAVAASARSHVILAEARARLGGDARLYGAVDREETPDAAVQRLTGELARRSGVDVLERTEMVGFSGTRVLLHRIVVTHNRPQLEVLSVAARHVVLATGTIERLPIFAGNRLPRVMGALEAHRRALSHGVWIGRSAIFATSHSAAYRLALHAHEVGISVARISDSRPQPRSRFIDFCKATGLPTMAGAAVSEASPAAREAMLAVRYTLTVEGATGTPPGLAAEHLVVGGAMQPDLDLWLAAGGSAVWNAARGVLLPQGELPHVTLAGAAAGLRSLSAAIRSGEAAAARARGRRVAPVADAEIDPLYESQDGRTPVSAPGGASKAYLDRAVRHHRGAFRPRGSGAELDAFAELGTLEAISAGVDLGLLPSGEAGPIAAERAAAGAPLIDTGWRVSPVEITDNPPDYLHGRFGPRALICRLEAPDGRRFMPGEPVFDSAEPPAAADAVGVIYKSVPGGGLALVAASSAGAESHTLFVTSFNGPVPARIVERRSPTPRS